MVLRMMGSSCLSGSKLPATAEWGNRLLLDVFAGTKDRSLHLCVDRRLGEVGQLCALLQAFSAAPMGRKAMAPITQGCQEDKPGDTEPAQSTCQINPSTFPATWDKFLKVELPTQRAYVS